MRYVFTALALLAIAGPALADQTGSAVTQVRVKVDPNISIQALDPSVDMGTVQTGTFQGYIPWRVDANTQYVQFWAAASGLYKGGDPDQPTVEPISVDLPSGVKIHIPDGGPIGGQDDNLQYTTTATIDGFPGWQTEAVEYESSTAGHLSQDVDMYVWWNQPDPEKPMGEYSGRVELSAMTVLF